MDTNELFSELSISLFGQPVTTQDILIAEIQPHFGAHVVHIWVAGVGISNRAQAER